MALSWRPRLPALSWRPRRAVADVLVALAVAAIMVLYPLVSRTDLAPMWPYGHLLLGLIASGLSNDEIAVRLVLGPAHGEDARQPHPAQAGGAGQGAARGGGVRIRARDAALGPPRPVGAEAQKR